MTEPSASPAPDDREQAIRSMEQELLLLWRRSRTNAHKVARQVHPEMEPAAYGLLATLQRKGTLRLTGLAAELGIGKPSVSRQVSALEKLGVVRREADPDDGRAQGISLTEAGLERLVRAQQGRSHVFHEVLEDWSQSELETLSGLLAKLNDSYRKDNS